MTADEVIAIATGMPDVVALTATEANGALDRIPADPAARSLVCAVNPGPRSAATSRDRLERARARAAERGRS
jgi:hypothetical protein